MLESELLAKANLSLNRSRTWVKRYPPKTVYGTVFRIGRYVFLYVFNAAFHEGTFQNCNFHVVNNFSKYGRE